MRKYEAKKMIKILTITIGILLALLIGTWISKKDSSAEQIMYAQETSSSTGNGYGITEEEKDFLLWNMINEEATIEQIRTGTLPDWKVNLLLKYRFCLKGLNNKYIGHEFRIQTYEKIGSDTWKFYAIDENEKTFNVIISAPDYEMLTDTYSEDG